jgi:transketolase
MGKSDGLYKYAKNVISIDRFGKSAPAEEVIADYGFTPEAVAEKIRKLVK